MPVKKRKELPARLAAQSVAKIVDKTPGPHVDTYGDPYKVIICRRQKQGLSDRGRLADSSLKYLEFAHLAFQSSLGRD